MFGPRGTDFCMFGPQHAVDQTFWQQFRYSCIPSTERLDFLRTQIRTELARQFSRVTKTRREAQAGLLKTDVEHNYGRKAWKTIREPLAPPITSLARPDGTITGNPAEMQQLIHQQWCAKVFCRYEDSTCQRPDPLTFLDQCRDYLPQQPTHQMPILTAPELKEALANGGSAGGLDGWRTAELRALPTWMWDLAAILWNEMTRIPQDHAEQHGPLVPCEGLLADFFLRGYCPLLDKGEGPEPLRQRALTILSRLYRQWSSVIYAQLQQFQAQWIHPSLSGVVKHRDSVSAAWEVTQALEIAVAAQAPHYTDSWMQRNILTVLIGM